MRANIVFMLLASLALAACGGDGGTDAGEQPPANPAGSFTLGGTVSGLAGSGLTLANGNDTLAVRSDGSFVWPTKIASGTSYSVKITAQPISPTQTCTVQNGTGTVGTADVVSIAIVCTTASATYAYAAVPHTAADPSVGRIEYFTFDPATGALALKGNLAAPAATYVFYVKPLASGRQLLVSTSTVIDRVLPTLRDDLTLYDLSSATGAPNRQALVASPGGGDLIGHPNGVDFYTAGASVYHYSLAAGAAQRQSADLGLQPGLASAITPDGKFLFTPNTGQDNGFVPFIGVVSLADPLRPVLVRKITTPFRPLTATISPDGKLLYVTPTDSADPGLVYRVDAAGGLVQSGSFAAPPYGRSTAITPAGNYLYVASSQANRVQGYRLDNAGGVTALDGGVTVPSAFRLVIGPEGRYLYVISFPVDGRPGAIYGFAIGAGGALTAVPGSPVVTGESEYDLGFAKVNP